MEVEYLSPLPMLQVAAMKGKGFSRLLAARLHATPSRRLSLMCYSDEIVPGNQLSHDNTRKVQTMYFSFAELGPAALADEECWFVGCVVRSSAVQKLVGGMAAVLGGFLRLLFDPSEHDVRVAGVALHFPGGQVERVFIDFRCKVADESALRQVWRCKGSAGTRPCLLCRNIVQYKCNKESDPLCAHDRSGLLLPHTTPNPERFDLHTKETKGGAAAPQGL